MPIAGILSAALAASFHRLKTHLATFSGTITDPIAAVVSASALRLSAEAPD